MNPSRTAMARTVMGALLLVVASFLTLAACSGEGGSEGSAATKMFSDDSFRISFSYPDEFRRGEITEAAASYGEPEAEAVVALDEHDMIHVMKFDVGAQVTQANLPEVVPDLNDIVAGLTGRPATGSPGTLAGLPAVTYDTVETPEVPGGQSRLVFLFDGSTEYTINCQSTPAKRDVVTAACDGALATLRITS